MMHKFVTGAAVVAAISALVVGPAGAAPSAKGHNSLTFSGGAGDYISGGQSYKYVTAHRRKQPKVTITLSRPYTWNNSIEATVIEGNYDHWWYLDLAARDNQDLAVGHYADAQRWPFNAAGHPGLSLSGDGRGCNEDFGEFTVRKLTRAQDGHITVLDVEFTQHCESPTAPALTGTLHYSGK